jgi:hypothetical protein
MGLLDLFRSKGTLSGRVEIQNLPEARLGYAVTVAFFRVASATTPLTWMSPPDSEIKDMVVIKDPKDPEGRPLHFTVVRPVGFYYVLVGVVLITPPVNGRANADIKRYFPPQEPLEVVADDTARVKLVFDWNTIPDALLKDRGVMRPQST